MWTLRSTSPPPLGKSLHFDLVLNPSQSNSAVLTIFCYSISPTSESDCAPDYTGSVKNDSLTDWFCSILYLWPVYLAIFPLEYIYKVINKHLCPLEMSPSPEIALVPEKTGQIWSCRAGNHPALPAFPNCQCPVQCTMQKRWNNFLTSKASRWFKMFFF